MSELRQRRGGTKRPTDDAPTTASSSSSPYDNDKSKRPAASVSDNKQNKKKRMLPTWMIIGLLVLYFLLLAVINPTTLPNLYYLITTKWSSHNNDDATTTKTDEENKTCGPIHSTNRVVFVRIPKTASTSLVNIFTTKNSSSIARVDLGEMDDLISSIEPTTSIISSRDDRNAFKQRLQPYYESAAKSIVYPPLQGQARTFYDGHLYLFNFTQHALSLAGSNEEEEEEEPWWKTKIPDWLLQLYNRPRPNQQELNIQQITLVRNPQDRLASMYYYDRHEARSETWRNAFVQQHGNVTLEECLLNQTCIEVNQLRRYCSLQTEILCGLHPKCARPVRQASLEVAKQNIQKNLLLFVGITERMEENLQLLSRLLPDYLGNESSFNKIPREKQSLVTRREQEFSKQAQEVLDDLCSLDNDLYAYVNQLLTERLEQCGVHQEEEEEEEKQRNGD